MMPLGKKKHEQIKTYLCGIWEYEWFIFFGLLCNFQVILNEYVLWL